LTAAEFALLALLQEAPAHGYLLAQRFAADQDLGRLYPLEQSMVYALLHDLERRGLVTAQQEAAGLRPTRTRFAITAAGEAQLRSWLTSPVQPLQRLRLDFLLKLHFAARQDVAGASRLIDAQLIAGEAYLSEVDADLAGLEPETLTYLVLESRRVAVASFLTWLQTRRERLHVVVAAQHTPTAAGHSDAQGDTFSAPRA
jgi:DNA-binding PadR family transcriptional regulator